MKKIRLTNGLVSIVDDDIYEIVKKFRWFGVQNGGKSTYYPAICKKTPNGKWRLIRLHHLVVGQPINRKLDVDHIDRNGLNNLRSNLRIVSRRENSLNTKANHRVYFNGLDLTISEWSKKLGVHHVTLLNRLKRWDSVEDALTKIPRRSIGGKYVRDMTPPELFTPAEEKQIAEMIETNIDFMIEKEHIREVPIVTEGNDVGE